MTPQETSTMEAQTTTSKAAMWNLDPSHSFINFSVKHMVISNASGKFKEFSGTAQNITNPNSGFKAEVEIDVNTITTENEMRDGHLKSPEFFDAANHPKAHFSSTNLEKIDEETSSFMVTSLSERLQNLLL